MKKLKHNEENEYCFKLENGDYLHLQYFDFNEDEMTSHCVTVDLIKAKDVVNFNDIEEITNKLPIWNKDNPIVIKLNLEIGQ